MGTRHVCRALIWTAWTAGVANAGELIPVDVHPDWGIPGPVFILDAPEANAPEVSPSLAGIPSHPLGEREGAERRPAMDVHAIAAALPFAPPNAQECPGAERFRVVDQFLEDHQSGPNFLEPYRGHDRLYVGTPSNILVYDTSDPAQPELLGKVPGGADDLYAFDGYLYALNDRGSSIYSLSDPDSPVLVAEVPGLEGQIPVRMGVDTNPNASPNYDARLCSLVGQLLPGVGWSFLLQVVDIADPENPTELYYIIVPSAVGVACYVQKAFVAAASGVFVMTLDRSGPIYQDYARSQGWPEDVFTPGYIRGDPVAYLYVGIPSGVMVYDISTGNPLLEYVSTWIDPLLEGDKGRGRHMDFQKDAEGHRLYIQDWIPGPDHHNISILDAADKDSLAWLGGWQGGIKRDAVPGVSGSYAYLPDPKLGHVVTVDISAPALPTAVGETWVGVDLVGLDVSDGRGAVSAQDRFYFFDTDLNGAASTVEMHVMESDSQGKANAEAINRIGDAVILRGYNPDISAKAGTCFDVSNPDSVTRAGSWRDWSAPWSASEGTRVYGGMYTVKVIDVSNPAQPDSLGALALGGRAFGGAVSGSLLAVRIFDGQTIKLIDVSDPAAPTEVGEVGGAMAPFLKAIALEDGLLVVAEDSDQPIFRQTLAFHDVSDPSTPSLISTLAWPRDGEILELVLEQGRLYAVSGEGKLYVLDVTDPSDPEWLGSYPEAGRPGAVLKVAAQGREVQVLGTSGVEMLRFRDLEASMEPTETPVVVEPGGAFEYKVRIENLASAPQSTQAWIDAILPDGKTYGPVLGPARLTLGVKESVEYQLTQPIPPVAPIGAYEYRIRLGSYSDAVQDQESFAFEVAPPAPTAPDTVWTRTFGGTGSEGGNCVRQTADGGFIIAGYTNAWNDSLAAWGAWLVRADSEGREIWNGAYGDEKIDKFYDVQELSDGGFIAVGNYQGFQNYPNSTLFLVRTDASGTEQWQRIFGSGGITDHEEGFSVRELADDGFAVAGYNTSYSVGSRGWLLRTDAGGNQSWSRLFAPSGGGDKFFAMEVAPDGGFLLAGYTQQSGTDPWLVRTDESGNELWSKTYEAPGGQGNLRGIVATEDGGYGLVGNSWGSESGSDALLIRVDSEGNELWTRTYGSDKSDSCYGLALSPSGGFAVTGYTNYQGASGYDGWLVGTAADGEELWSQDYGGANTEWLNHVELLSDGGYALVGLTSSYGPAGTNLWLLRLAGP